MLTPTLDERTETPVLSLRGLTKRFQGTVALDDVDLDILDGEVHALVGQNGSGKSTLIKILAGYHKADAGEDATLVGAPLDLGSTTRDHTQRLRFVHQDLGLFLELSTVDNLALRGAFLTDAIGRVQWRKQRAQAEELLGSFGLHLDVDRPLAEATPVQRTVVAIAAALAGWEGGPGLLVLDEPTAVLPPSDVSRLLEIVRQVRSRGTAILYVSHRLDEIFEIADRVTVLRGGKRIETRPVAGLDAQGLAEAMVGRDVDASYRADLPPADERPVVLSARDITGPFLGGVAIELREGEVLGIAGLPGSGRSELPYALVGALPGATGQIRLSTGDWTPLSKSLVAEIPIVPADRGREGVFADMGVGENLSVAVLERLQKMWRLRKRAERSLVGDWMGVLQIKAGSSSAPITTLSGGNQQKVVMARCLMREPRVLLLCEPTAGVDVGTRQAIYEFLAERARQKLALIVSSSDTGDLLAICTRVLVMCNGRIVRELRGAEITERSLLTAMEETEQQ